MKKTKKTTNFKPINDEDVVNKPYPDEKLKKYIDMFLTLKKITTNLNKNTTKNL